MTEKEENQSEPAKVMMMLGNERICTVVKSRHRVRAKNAARCA